MDDLALVGVHDDGEHLLLTAPAGQRFRLRVDESVRAAVRRDRARLSQLQLESGGGLRPREIQARIRAGESAEDVADAAGIDLAHVQRYEGPVLAERAYVADQARTVRLRRGATSDPQELGELVRETLVQRGVDADAAEWDAWRAEDGAWTVLLTWTAQGAAGQARWTYDPGLRHLTPQDDAARELTAEEPADPAPVPQRRLAPVRDRVFDVDAAARQEDAAVDLLDTLRERRGRRSRPLTAEEDEVGGLDPVRDAIDSLLSRAELTRAEALVEAPTRHRPDPPDQHEHEVLVLPDAEPALDKHPDDGPARVQRQGRRNRRASVPSWDDIVFGQRRD